jgi:hypothetical protein
VATEALRKEKEKKLGEAYDIINQYKNGNTTTE